MKKLLRGCLLAVAVGVLIVGTANASPLVFTFTPDSAVALDQSTSPTSKSVEFYIPWNTPITFAAVVIDSGAGNTTSTDSLAFTLQTGIAVERNSSPLVANSQWTDGCEIVLGWNKGIDERSEIRYLALDSINVGTYKVGGIARVVMHAGVSAGGDGANYLDTLACDVEVDVYVSWEGQE
jgi:hypothetical protein